MGLSIGRGSTELESGYPALLRPVAVLSSSVPLVWRDGGEILRWSIKHVTGTKARFDACKVDERWGC